MTLLTYKLRIAVPLCTGELRGLWLPHAGHEHTSFSRMHAGKQAGIDTTWRQGEIPWTDVDQR